MKDGISFSDIILIMAFFMIVIIGCFMSVLLEATVYP